MIKKITPLILVLISFNAGYSQINFEDISVKDALLKAEKEDKKVFIDVYTSWCGPCKYMSANVFTNKKIGERMNESYISLKIDYEKSPYRNEVVSYGIKGYPTMLILDTKGIEIGRIYGSRSVDQFHSELDDLSGKTTSPLMEAFEDMEANPDDQKIWKQSLKIIGEDWNVLNRFNLLDQYYEACERYYIHFNIDEIVDNTDMAIFKSAILPVEHPAVTYYLNDKKDYGSYFHKDYMVMALKKEANEAKTKKQKETIKEKAEAYYKKHEEHLNGDVEPLEYFLEQIFGRE